jgi:hypothetical protein
MHVLIPQPLVKFIERILPKNHLIAHNVYQGYYAWFVKISYLIFIQTFEK